MQMGKSFRISTTVNESMLAPISGGGDVRVLGTPAMIALMEQAAVQCMQEMLGEGETSVSTMMEVSHIGAVPSGGQITATAEMSRCSGKRVIFKVFCEDCTGLVGKGTHERIIVNRERFQMRAQQKLVRS